MALCSSPFLVDLLQHFYLPPNHQSPLYSARYVEQKLSERRSLLSIHVYREANIPFMRLSFQNIIVTTQDTQFQ
jgi:hypothetical protein